jgi:hypothetical protein
MPMNPRTLRPSSTFTPKNISGLALWLDAADGSTLFQNSDGTTPATATSDPVGYWRDKSGNNRHATQATAANRPTISATTQNGRRTLALDGSNDMWTAPGGQALKDGATLIAAYFSGSVNFSSAFGVGNSVAGQRWNIGSAVSRYTASYFTGDLTVTGSALNNTGIVTGVFDKANNVVRLRLQGTEAESETGSPALASFSSDTMAIGGMPLQNEQWLAGRMFEVLAYNRVLTASEARRIEQYLGRKWGITLAPQVSNADAQDWVNRVYANGGTVSTSTANAVNSFCDAIDAASIRDRFYRLNLFAGTGLNAALVPVYRGTSLGGTQYGNATDTNNGPFVSGDYAETGASGGLLGNGSSKYLDTGLTQETVGSNGHHAFYHDRTGLDASSRSLGGVTNGARTQRYTNFAPSGTDVLVSTFGAVGSVSDSGIAPGFNLTTRRADDDLEHYVSGVSAGNLTSSVSPINLPRPFGVFATVGLSDTNAVDTAYGYWDDRIKAYSFGLDMTTAQAEDYYDALQAFQIALGRQA